MKLKTILVTSGVLACLLLIIAVVVVIPFLRSPPDVELRVDNGVVEVFQTAWVPAVSGMKLADVAAVRTQDGKATIIFFGASLLRLDAHTEVKLTEVNENLAKVSIQLAHGRIWNRVIHSIDNPLTQGLNLKGIKEYEIQLPTAVATVRGTSFSVDTNSLSVVTGKVSLAKDEKETFVEHATAVIGKEIVLKELMEDEWINDNRAKDTQFDDDIIARIKKTYWPIIVFVKQKYGVTDDIIDQTIRDYLAGKISDEKIQAFGENIS